MDVRSKKCDQSCVEQRESHTGTGTKTFGQHAINVGVEDPKLNAHIFALQEKLQSSSVPSRICNETLCLERPSIHLYN